MGREIRQVDTRMLADALAYRQPGTPPRNVLDDTKLVLAISMFGAANSVYNLKVRFVLLVTVLEILAHSGQRPQFSQEAVASLLEHLKTKHPRNEAESLQSQKICSAVGQLRTLSITEGLCELVFQSCAITLPEFADREKSDEIVKDIYAMRGDLAHKGRVSPPEEGTREAPFIERFEQLRKAVSGVLKYRMEHPEPEP
jgi:hypothetical protein